jgi:DNA-binding transcriptional MerR regulator
MTHAKASKATPKRRPRKAAATPGPATERPLKIGEAARIIGVEPYVLRFWETQFPILRPRHSRSKHRSYESGDIETLKLIKRLLHTEGFTIAGAKKLIREIGAEKLREGRILNKETVPDGRHNHSSGEPCRAHRMLAEIREDLLSLHKLLGRSASD